MTRFPLPLTAAVTESPSALRCGKVRRCARRDNVQTEGERATLRPWPMRTRIGSLERLEALDEDVLVLIGLGASGCKGAGRGRGAAEAAAAAKVAGGAAPGKGGKCSEVSAGGAATEGAGVAALLLDFFFFLEGEALGGADGVRGRFSGCFPCAFSDMAGAAGGVEGRVGAGAP